MLASGRHIVKMGHGHVALIGAGHLAVSVPVLASLSSYFGERPMTLTLFDPDSEKVDLAFRLAQTVFTCAKAEHALAVTDSLDELAGDFTRVVYCANARSARIVNRWAGVEATCTDGASIEQAVAYLHAHLMSTASKEGTPLVLSLLPSEVLLPGLKHSRIDWPKAWIDDRDGRLAHQVLRWVRGDEPVFDLIQAYKRSPFLRWLDAAQ